jgi:hypothetical protein
MQGTSLITSKSYERILGNIRQGEARHKKIRVLKLTAVSRDEAVQVITLSL